MGEGKILSREEIVSLVTDRISFYLDKPKEEIDPSVELALYGMDSVYAISVVSDIEDRLQVEVDLTEIRQYTTVETIADYLFKVMDQ